MATQEQLTALQQILNIAQKSGLNNNEEQKYPSGQTQNIHNLDELHKKMDAICKNNTHKTFLIYCNIDNIQQINKKYSKMVSEQLSTNVLSSIQSVAMQQFSKYNLLIYKIAAYKTAIIVILKSDNTNANIKIIKNIATAMETMICGSTQSKISIAVSARTDNEDKNSLLSRTDLLLQKQDCVIAYDTQYFGTADSAANNQFSDVSFNVSGNEIITICVGGSGTNIGNEFYKLIMNEHKINKTGEFMGDLKDNLDNVLLDKINTYFNCKKDTFCPRSIFIDLDLDNLNTLQAGYLGSLVDTDSFCGYSGSTKVNSYWPQGHYTSGKEIFYNIKDVIRSTIELCDNLQGFNIFHAISGGSGGGLTSLIQSTLRDDYSTKIFANFCIYPTTNDNKNQNDILSNYNSLLTLNTLRTKTDLIFAINNASVRQIATKKLNLKPENITFADYNWLISLVLSGVTSSFRFYGEPELVSNLSKMYMTFALHSGSTHLSMAHSPFFSDKIKTTQLSAAQIKSEILSKTNNISCGISSKIDMIKSGKVIQHVTVYKSNNDAIINDFDHKMRGLTSELYDDKLVIDPMPFQSSLIYKQCSFYDKYTPLIATSIIHSTAILKIYKNMRAVFKTNFQQKKMLAQFYDQGMDSYEFIEADKNINQLIQKYKKYQDAKIVDSDEESDEKDDDDYDEGEDEEEDY